MSTQNIQTPQYFICPDKEVIEMSNYLPINIKSSPEKYSKCVEFYYQLVQQGIKSIHASYYVINQIPLETINKVQEVYKKIYNFREAYCAVKNKFNDEQIEMVKVLCKKLRQGSNSSEYSSIIREFNYYMGGNSSLPNSYIIKIVKKIKDKKQFDNVIKFNKDKFDIASILNMVSKSDEYIDIIYKLIEKEVDKNDAGSLTDENLKTVMEFINEGKIDDDDICLLFFFWKNDEVLYDIEANDIIPIVKKLVNYNIDIKTAAKMAVDNNHDEELLLKMKELVATGKSWNNAYNMLKPKEEEYDVDDDDEDD